MRRRHNGKKKYWIIGVGYEREGKFISGEGKILTDVEFYIFSNEIANYVKQLPLERKKQKMMEMVIMFHKIFETI